MSRLVTLGILVLSLVVGLFAQTPAASPQASNKLLSDAVNAQLPKWLQLGGEYRARVEGFTGGGFKANNEDTYLLSRLRLNLFLRPETWLKFGFQAQDARAFWKNQNPAAPPYQRSSCLLCRVPSSEQTDVATGSRVQVWNLELGFRFRRTHRTSCSRACSSRTRHPVA